ncbi:5-formyltetrahydrofolate cyclo-ligase [Lapidilactobacillus wuchangensis]|uniref:5-formyltetrahydrofolate cyclo-ligase n=1 Tax=Lapidilactobacillus wuchangensis TaxID=2486001 RepID=UPI000F7BB0AF|nr:5-formyltetrahydrofolate cyclo-ligase [Lapidilactobacillus wuchangensis]
MKKKELRQQQIAQLQQLDPLLKRQEEASLYQQLWQLPLYQQAQSIGVTVSSPLEVATQPIIERAWQDQKQVYLPRTYPETHGMHFFEYQSDDELIKSDFGIPEPAESKTQLDQLDLLLVPGLIYTADGWRVGFGGGYYDRFLADYPQTTVILALNAMVVSEPVWQVGRYDQQIELVVTPR